MLTSGFFSDWNDLPRKNAVWLVDRILRSRIESTLPERNVDTSAAPVVVNVQPSQRNEPFVLVRPGGIASSRWKSSGAGATISPWPCRISRSAACIASRSTQPESAAMRWRTADKMPTSRADSGDKAAIRRVRSTPTKTPPPSRRTVARRLGKR